jgi:small subunit ribosomal protein S9
LNERDEQQPDQPAEETMETTEAAETAEAAAEESAPEPASETAPEQTEVAVPAAAEADAPEAEAPEAEAPEAEAPEAEAPEADSPEPPAEPIPTRTLDQLAADARYSATGKRKTAVARVIIRPGSGQFDLNGRSLEVYFPRRVHQAVVRHPLEIVGFADRMDVRARVHGGGISGQADAVRHGIAKALIEADPALRGELKRRQLLTRDPREKERRKAGLKKARKRPQFSKR